MKRLMAICSIFVLLVTGCTIENIEMENGAYYDMSEGYMDYLKGNAPINHDHLLETPPAGYDLGGMCGNDAKWGLKEDTGELEIFGTGSMWNYTVGSTPWNRYKPKSVHISGVSNVGQNAFYGCNSLTSVAFSADVTSIESGAFMECDGLTSVVISDYVTQIDESAFDGCSSLVSITLGAAVDYIGGEYGYEGAFHNCESLTEINVSESNQNYAGMDGVLFNKNCTKIMRYPQGKSAKAYSIPYGVKCIAAKAFLDCENLTQLNIPASVTKIEYKALDNTGLRELTVPYSVESMGYLSIKGLEQIHVGSGNPTYTSIDGVLFSADRKELLQYPAGRTQKTYEVPDGTIFVGNFRNCVNLEEIVICDTATAILDSAFAQCKNLKKVTIPVSVTVIDLYAFRDCENLTDVYYGGTEEQWDAISIQDENKPLHRCPNFHFVD